MNINSLSFFKKIKGVASASALIYQQDILYLISDDALVLYSYDLKKDKLKKQSLLKNNSIEEQITKAKKTRF